MNAEILTTIPTSGEFTERHFGENFNSGLWVKFTSNNSEEWVGCFSKLYDKGLSVALTNEINSTSFVVAGGHGFLIDVDEKKLITEFDQHTFIESAIRTTNPEYFIAGAIYQILVLNETGLLKSIQPSFIVDGIYFKNHINNNAIGELATAENQYEGNVDFEFDLTTFEISLKYKPKTSWIEKIWNKKNRD